MGVSIVATDVDAENVATAYASPVRRALEGIHFLNDSLEKCQRNYAPGKSSLKGTIFGAPVVNSSFLRCTGLQHFLQTGIAESRNGTMFVIARNLVDDGAVANRTMPAGTYRGDGGVLPGSSGVGFYGGGSVSRLSGLSNHAPNDDATATLVTTAIQVIPLTVWALLSLTFSDTLVVCRNLSVPFTAQATPTSMRRVSPDKIRVGSGYTSYVGGCDVALFQYHSAVLSEDELQLVAADLRSYAAGRGITV
ncbi:hypothetical protein [Pseudomonas putida]|uniref:Uncharacterized protein n=1 Tax=Pseudomonas putida TaxID=303 RepID=A0A8I1EF28_PSEPU|nr:hypothetical protein [Pseudomonas putida]MBI6884023.1 hypothetical protein [Pseudomonas putida]